MSEFTYVDIFATKGLEYLLVLGYLVVFVFFVRALTRSGSSRRGKDGGDDHGVAH